VLSFTSPLQAMLYSAASGLVYMGRFAIHPFGQERENQRLREKVSQLELELARQKALLAEKERIIQQLSAFRRASSEKIPVIVARSIGFDPTQWRKSRVIDVGSAEGVTPGDLVLAGSAVVGRVRSVGKWASQVQLITDPGFRHWGRLALTEHEGLIEGRAVGNLLMKYLPQTSDIERGDTVLAAGLGEEYPAGLIIGFVSELPDPLPHPRAAFFKEVKVAPAADLTRLNNLLVLLRKRPEGSR
jgi:rod shape-determining protein MreC